MSCEMSAIASDFGLSSVRAAFGYSAEGLLRVCEFSSYKERPRYLRYVIEKQFTNVH